MPERIDDLDDPRLADYRQLKDAVARRKIEGDELFVAEGPVAIDRMIASGHTVRSVLVLDRKYDRMAALLDGIAATTFIVDDAVLLGVAGFDLHRGAIAAGQRRPTESLAAIATTTHRVAVLEGLNDPENLGAVARSARALGIEALVLDPTCIDPYTRRTVRVSMGEILMLRWCRAAAHEWPGGVFDVLHASGFDTWAMTPAVDSNSIWELRMPQRLAVVLGAEGSGLSRQALATSARRVRLPIDPDVDSLNVAAAAAVTFAIVARPQTV